MLHALVGITRRVLRRLPRPLACRAGGVCGAWIARVSRNAAHLSILQAEQATGSRLGREVRGCPTIVARRMGENLADVLRAGPDEWPPIAIEGRAHLDRALSAGRGAVVVSAHHGPWELLPVALARAGYRVALITRPLRDPHWEALVTAFRASAGIRSFPRGTPLSEVVSWTSQGGVLGIAMDQRIRGAVDPGTFLGLPAPVVRGPGTIARRAGAPLLACTVRRVGPDALRATMSREIAAGPRTSAVLARHLDVLVRRDVTQWVWWHERFWPAPPPWPAPRAAATSGS